MPDFLIVSLNTQNNDKPKWVGNHTSITFQEFKNPKILPHCVFFESLTSHQPYFIHDNAFHNMVQTLNKKYGKNKNQLKEIYILENEFTAANAEKLNQLLIDLNFKNVKVRFYNAHPILEQRYAGSPFFFQIGERDQEGYYSVTTLVSMKKKYDENLIHLNKNYNTITINQDVLKRQGIVLLNSTRITKLLIPETKFIDNHHYSQNLFEIIKNFFENMTWINWLLSKHIFKKDSLEFTLLNDLKNEIEIFKNAYEQLHNNYLFHVKPLIEKNLNNSKNRLDLINHYFNQPSDELFQIIQNYQKPSFTSYRIPLEILKQVQDHHEKFTDIKNKLEHSIDPKRAKLINYVREYLTKNSKSVHGDKLKVMQVLLEHLQDPENVDKKNSLLEAINTKPNWANHFFKSRTLEAVQKAQELMEADKQVKEILQPKASITS